MRVQSSTSGVCVVVVGAWEPIGRLWNGTCGSCGVGEHAQARSVQVGESDHSW